MAQSYVLYFPILETILTKVLLDIKTLEVFSATLAIVRPPKESWYKSSEPVKDDAILLMHCNIFLFIS